MKDVSYHPEAKGGLGQVGIGDGPTAEELPLALDDPVVDVVAQEPEHHDANGAAPQPSCLTTHNTQHAWRS